MSNLIQVEELHGRLAADSLRLLDVRFSLADPQAGRVAYLRSHLPAAVHVDLDRHLSGTPERHGGRHPLPPVEQLAEMFGRIGVDGSHDVVVYDDATGMFAARAWWVLRYLGHENVRVLNGGFNAWQAAELPLVTEEPDWPATRFKTDVQQHMIVDRAYLLNRLDSGDLQLLDARAPERFRGEREPLDPLAGRIPGARNYWFEENLTAGKLLDPAALRERFATIDHTGKIVTYCGSGVSGAHNVLALEEAGLSGARLYPGSWSDWISYPDAPVQTGPEETPGS